MNFSEYIPETLMSLINSGGFVIIILLALSVFVLTIILYKLMQFLSLGLILRRSLDQTIKLWLSGDRSQAYNRVSNQKTPRNIVLSHLMRGLQTNNADEIIIREDVERVATTQLAKVRSHFRIIEAVVQIAPLIGLFGTVLGMIETFQSMQNAGVDVDPGLLASGIWIALLTTAVGLAIAIPSAFILYWFEALADNEQREMELAVTSLLTKRVTEGQVSFANKS